MQAAKGPLPGEYRPVPYGNGMSSRGDNRQMRLIQQPGSNGRQVAQGQASHPHFPIMSTSHSPEKKILKVARIEP